MPGSKRELGDWPDPEREDAGDAATGVPADADAPEDASVADDPALAGDFSAEDLFEFGAESSVGEAYVDPDASVVNEDPCVLGESFDFAISSVGELFNASVDKVPDPSTLIPATPAPAPVEGRQEIGGYRLLGVLGRGGMGTVFHAVQLGTRREVALKVTSVEAAVPGKPQRFLQEARIAASLDHPHIARIYDAKMEGTYYLCAMELVQGQTLNRYWREHKLSMSDKVRLMVKVCQALSYAHHFHVVHRDLKPTNILVTAEGEPKVVDFGLAKLLRGGGSPHASSADRTLEGTYLGTPGYMAPEQALGQVSAVGPRSDIFSLGVLLYGLATGKHPFMTERTSPMQLLARVVHAEAPRPSSVAKVPMDIEYIILKAMAKAPEDRYATADDMASDLQRYLDNEPVEARPATLGYLVSKRLRKSWPALVVLVALALLLLASVAGADAYAMYRGRASIRRAAGEAAQHLNTFLAPAVRSLRVIERWAQSGLLKAEDADATLRLVMPLLEEVPTVVYLSVADAAGNAMAIAQDAGEYVVRETSVVEGGEQPLSTRWFRFDRDGSVVDAGDSETTIDARTLPWYVKALRGVSEGASVGPLAWSDPYDLVIGAGRGVSVSTAAMDAQGHIVAIHLPMASFAEALADFDLESGGVAMITTSSGEVLGMSNIPSPLMQGQAVTARDAAARRQDIYRALRTLRHEPGAREGQPVILEMGGEAWWADLSTLPLGPSDYASIRILIPRSRLDGNIRSITLIAGGGLLGLALLAASIVWPRSRRS